MVDGTEVVLECRVLLSEVDPPSRPPDNEVVVPTGLSLVLAAFLAVTTLSVGFDTGGLASEVVDSTGVVTEVIRGVVITTGLSLVLAACSVPTTLSVVFET